MDFVKVFAAFDFLPEEEEIGTLSHEYIRGQHVYGFEYDRSWLSAHHDIKLSADIENVLGRQFRKDHHLFSCFTDCNPDRWGKVIINEHYKNIHPGDHHSLSEWDYLLGVSDEGRTGAFRFHSLDGHLIGENDRESSIPPIVYLDRLRETALYFEKNWLNRVSTNDAILRQLIYPGSSVGGARPKALTMDTDGMYIAKFPSASDTYDVGSLELFANRLASECGINVSAARICMLGNRHQTFLSKRFDRNQSGQRIHMSSSLTLTGLSDGCGYGTGNGYLDIVDAIDRYSSDAERDIKELYRRIAFSICIGNTDDHFRNHAFLLGPDGWSLSPSYDVNPSANKYHALLIDRMTNESSLSVLLDAHEDYMLTSSEAYGIVNDVTRNIRYWESVAKKCGVSREDMAMINDRINYGLSTGLSTGLRR